MAGSSFITTIDKLDAPFAAVESGQIRLGPPRRRRHDRDRQGHMDGRRRGQNVRRPVEELPETSSTWRCGASTSAMTDFGKLALTVSGYDGNWHPTEQIPERAIGTAVCADAFCALDPTAGGHTSRWISARSSTAINGEPRAMAQYYDWDMQSNPTYDYELSQFDRRYTAGGLYDRTLLETAKLSLNVGGRVSLRRYRTRGPRPFRCRPRSWKTSARTRSTKARWPCTPKRAGRRSTSCGCSAGCAPITTTSRRRRARPGASRATKATIACRRRSGSRTPLNRDFELYANWGRGFHSNDARGVVNTAADVPGLSPGTGYEGGARFEVGAVKLTATYWWLNLDSELVFVGDSNSVEPKGASRRDGYELTLFYRPAPWLGDRRRLHGQPRARYVDSPDGKYIEGSWRHAGRARHLDDEESIRGELASPASSGPYPLTPDNVSARAPTRPRELPRRLQIRKVSNVWRAPERARTPAAKMSSIGIRATYRGSTPRHDSD